MEIGTRWYAHISYSRVTGCGGPRQVKEHHYGAHRSYSPAPMAIFSSPLMVVNQITHYTQDIHYYIPSDWVVHNSTSGYMNCNGWHKSMAHLPFMCCSSTLYPQVIFYDRYDSHVDDREMDILLETPYQVFHLKGK